MWAKYFAVTVSYGIVRNATVMTRVPMGSDELYVGRAVILAMSSMCAPIWWPMMVGSDLANLERKLRGQKVKLFVPLLIN
jgi:hypothetical protein